MPWFQLPKLNVALFNPPRCCSCAALRLSCCSPQHRSFISRLSLQIHQGQVPAPQVLRPFGTSNTSANPLQCQQTDSAGTASSATYIKRTLRSGSVVEHDGSVVVYGDVKPGASVIAGADVIVLGRLLGEAHAGAYGDPHARIVALEMNPMQLRIADVAAYNSKSFAPTGQPQVACIDMDTATIRLVPTTSQPAWSRPLDASMQLQFSAADLAALFTGGYILLAGFALTLAPVTVFGLLFDTGQLTPGWIRVGGVLASLFGFYYCGAAFGGASGAGVQGFYASTIAGRVYLCVAFCLIAARGEVALSLLILAAVNLWGAISMYFALRRHSAS